MAKAAEKVVDPFAPVGPPAIETLQSAHDRIRETRERAK